ncbi:MAG: SusC/RagA family TonB-linked outer membrane protein [Bacteroidia bacterium]|nr:SusC/RagA family TonB-linked outer membrane protein [Bacteroidia bacterium]
MKKVLLFLTVCALSYYTLHAQTRVSGKVTQAASGEPVEGATVIVEGTTTGVLTDATGAYSLTVPPDGKVLVFSFVGLKKQRYTLDGNTTINIVMEQDILELSEVVVTAYGIGRERKALGYGVENLKGEDIAQKSEPDALRSIQGKIAGVNISGSSSMPGSSTRITIRGNSSLLGDNQPLFIVDGIPYNNNDNLPAASFNQLVGSGATSTRIADIDPNNIQSITVLKGAAAAALYGTRAANGVIVINTKSGNTALGAQKLRVTVNSSLSFEQIASLPEYQNTYGSGTNFAYSQVNGSWGAPFVGAKPYASVTTIPHWYANEPGFEELRNATVPYQAYPNNVSDFFKTGVVYDNSVSFNAGTENAAVSAVISYLNQDGFIPNTHYKKFNLGLGGKAQTDNKKFSFDWNLQFTNSDQRGGTGGANNAVGNSSLFSRTMFLGRNWDLQGQPYARPTDSASVFFIARTQAANPRWSALYEGISSQVNRFLASTRFNYKFTDWLSISYILGYNTYNDAYREWYNPGSRAANQVGKIINNDVTFTELESNLLLTLEKELSPDVYVKAILGNNINERTTDQQAFQGTGYITFNINDVDNTNSVIPFGGGFSRQRILGYFADVTVSYKNYLYLGLKGRNDMASTLGINSRSFFYPGVNLAFAFTDALGVNSEILTFGKLRASWAQVGNAPGPYLTQSVFIPNPLLESTSSSFADFPFRGVPGSTLEDNAYDPDLRSELTTEIELGLEMRFFQNRMGFDVAVYDRLSKDQLANIAIPAETGFTNYFTNLGEVRNRGIEVSFDINPVKTKSFSWDVLTTFTHNRNTIEDLGDLDEITLRNTFTGSVSAVHIEGQEYGLIRGTVNARDDEGNLLIDPSNGQMIRSNNQEIIGNPNPDFIMGFINTFNYRGISLGVVVDYRQGGDLYSVTNLSLLGRGVTMDTEDREINKIIPGVYGDPNTGEPIRDGEGNKIQNGTMIEVNSIWFGETFGINSADEWNVFDATVIRLREVSLGYSLPQSLLAKTPLGGVSINVVGRNLWYNAPNFPPASNFDPETSTFGNSNAQGFEFTTAPSLRRLGVNISLTF